MLPSHFQNLRIMKNIIWSWTLERKDLHQSYGAHNEVHFSSMVKLMKCIVPVQFSIRCDCLLTGTFLGLSLYWMHMGFYIHINSVLSKIHGSVRLEWSAKCWALDHKMHKGHRCAEKVGCHIGIGWVEPAAWIIWARIIRLPFCKGKCSRNSLDYLRKSLDYLRHF